MTINKHDLSDAAFLSEVSSKIQSIASLMADDAISKNKVIVDLIELAILIDENNPIRRIDLNAKSSSNK